MVLYWLYCVSLEVEEYIYKYKSHVSMRYKTELSSWFTDFLKSENVFDERPSKTNKNENNLTFGVPSVDELNVTKIVCCCELYP